MAVLIIPVDSDHENYSLEQELDGEQFTLRLRWASRDESWYMDLHTLEGEEVFLGRRIAVGAFLLWQNQNENRPQGQIVAIDTTGKGQDPGRNDLGNRVQLYYLDALEMEAA